MNAKKILHTVGLKPNDTIFPITQSGAMVALLEFIEEWELQIKVLKKLVKKIGKLFLQVMPTQLLIIIQKMIIKNGQYF